MRILLHISQSIGMHCDPPKWILHTKTPENRFMIRMLKNFTSQGLHYFRINFVLLCNINNFDNIGTGNYE